MEKLSFSGHRHSQSFSQYSVQLLPPAHTNICSIQALPFGYLLNQIPIFFFFRFPNISIKSLGDNCWYYILCKHYFEFLHNFLYNYPRTLKPPEKKVAQYKTYTLIYMYAHLNWPYTLAPRKKGIVIYWLSLECE